MIRSPLRGGGMSLASPSFPRCPLCASPPWVNPVTLGRPSEQTGGPTSPALDARLTLYRSVHLFSFYFPLTQILASHHPFPRPPVRPPETLPLATLREAHYFCGVPPLVAAMAQLRGQIESEVGSRCGPAQLTRPPLLKITVSSFFVCLIFRLVFTCFQPCIGY